MGPPLCGHPPVTTSPAFATLTSLHQFNLTRQPLTFVPGLSRAIQPQQAEPALPLYRLNPVSLLAGRRFGAEVQIDGSVVVYNLRYSFLDLNDEDVEGGKEANLTLGLNWYLNRNYWFKFNYIRVNVWNRGSPPIDDEEADVLQLRFQLSF